MIRGGEEHKGYSVSKPIESVDSEIKSFSGISETLLTELHGIDGWK
jgi:hypothetical protein